MESAQSGLTIFKSYLLIEVQREPCTRYTILFFFFESKKTEIKSGVCEHLPDKVLNSVHNSSKKISFSFIVLQSFMSLCLISRLSGASHHIIK